MTGTSVETVLAELTSLADPRIREVNERHGDAHAVNLGTLRALAKELRTQHELSGERRTRSRALTWRTCASPGSPTRTRSSSRRR